MILEKKKDVLECSLGISAIAVAIIGIIVYPVLGTSSAVILLSGSALLVFLLSYYFLRLYCSYSIIGQFDDLEAEGQRLSTELIESLLESRELRIKSSSLIVEEALECLYALEGDN